MKRLLPLLLVLLLLAACGTAPETPEKDPVLPPETEPASSDTPVPTPHEGPDEDELPILTGEEIASPGEEESTAPPYPSRAVTVTLDGLSSYLRVTLPEGWVWEEKGGTVGGTVYGLRPENDPDFVVELQYWPDRFGMCGTGVTFQDYTLPDGRTATLAYEIGGEEIFWTLILPESPDSFTIQYAGPYALYEAHRAELELMLGTIRQGVLAGLDVVQPETAAG